ncbi:xylose isomerase-like TIM barrel protein [Ruminiclostridium sufflavum DSM 19573]|uniref:Xylose isomerase-like TIM barrel protein n=1 Tax=Ruminiclostridium sufflavum DSM 19573 TaxID=1121337 RepID=A0A318Y5X3_9FIRM|nr:TIM barrel protein [Ruminiclostridium sufflavum]PYG87390.1 xylose isomerase-like TIM barrel protein [Ruminiclostridium sufflavum DSM 19573]
MLRLMNFSDSSYDLDRFSNDYRQINDFLKKHYLNGLEMIQCAQWKEELIPSSMIIGLHMRFWPIWLDFWRDDREELLRQFGDEASYVHYYGGRSKEALLEYYRSEIKAAGDMGVKYIVFHVSHVQLEHCYNYRFTYSDDEIIDAFIEMINEILDGVEADFDILLENQWWPGLTLLNKNAAVRLLEGIRYGKKGFMLDIGHLMNTNTELSSEEEAVEYTLMVLEQLEEVSGLIKGIHLNSSLSGEYVKRQINECTGYNVKDSFFDRYLKAFGHIARIDRHLPFMNPSIKRVIDFIKPEYLVYEFITGSYEELEQYAAAQNIVLD